MCVYHLLCVYAICYVCMPFVLEFTRGKTSFVATGITQYTLNPHICLLMQHFIYESDGDYTYQGSSSTRLIMTQKRSIRPLLLNVSILHQQAYMRVQVVLCDARRHKRCFKFNLNRFMSKISRVRRNVEKFVICGW